MNDKDLITQVEIADIFGIFQSKVHEYIKHPHFPKPKIIKRGNRTLNAYPFSEVEEWLELHTKKKRVPKNLIVSFYHGLYNARTELQAT